MHDAGLDVQPGVTGIADDDVVLVAGRGQDGDERAVRRPTPGADDQPQRSGPVARYSA